MRSLGFTLILALLATLVCGVAGWQLKQGNFDSIFGAPPVAVGKRIYTEFAPADVKHILISQNGVNASFELGEHGWQATVPWKDRMDPRAAVEIIDFTLTLRVEDQDDSDKIDAQKAGFNKESGVNIRLEGANRQVLAKYKLGRQTPWFATVEGADKPVPTFFVQPRDADHKRFVYAVTGDISPWFKDGVKRLRDHQPFYFNPLNLQKIRIQTSQAEVNLSRETPKSPWRLIKTQDLATDPKAVKSLIEGLYKLEAAKVTDRASLPLASPSTTAKSSQIAITSFGTETETILDIYPADPSDPRYVRATVSDRPDTVFELLLKPEPNKVSLADLPLTINDLRDASLTNLNRKVLRGVRIQPTNGKEILISRTPPAPWVATIDGQTQDANEQRLFSLLTTVTEGRATGFKTDAATDFTPWGLDKPFLKLTFLGPENQPGVELAFGTDGKGGYFVNRIGTNTVMSVDPGLVSAIPVKAFEWRQARLWSIDRGNLKAISRQTAGQPPLKLLYDDATGDWTANSNRTDLTSKLDPSRANYLLGILEGLQVTRWLSPDDDSADKALLTPSLVFMILENQTNEMLDVTGLINRGVVLAPASPGPNPAFYYGRLRDEDQPFMLDRDSYEKLATDLLDKD